MFTIQLSTNDLQLALDRMAGDQIPFAVSKALNDLAIRAADAERAVARHSFTIRNEAVLKYGIARTHKATKSEPWTDVHVSETMTGGREAFGYLKKFETGGTKSSIDGSTVAVPQAVRYGKKGIVPKSLRIPQLQLKRIGRQIKGAQNTFMIKPKSGHAAALILQRVGHKHSSRVRVLYVLERSVPIQPVLHFEQTMEQVGRAEWPDAWEKAITYAMATARPKP